MSNERFLENEVDNFRKLTDRNIASIRNKVPVTAASSNICENCEALIPMARAAIGYTICVDCARLYEAKDRVYRR